MTSYRQWGVYVLWLVLFVATLNIFLYYGSWAMALNVVLAWIGGIVSVFLWREFSHERKVG